MINTSPTVVTSRGLKHRPASEIQIAGGQASVEDMDPSASFPFEDGEITYLAPWLNHGPMAMGLIFESDFPSWIQVADSRQPTAHGIADKGVFSAATWHHVAAEAAHVVLSLPCEAGGGRLVKSWIVPFLVLCLVVELTG